MAVVGFSRCPDGIRALDLLGTDALHRRYPVYQAKVVGIKANDIIKGTEGGENVDFFNRNFTFLRFFLEFFDLLQELGRTAAGELAAAPAARQLTLHFHHRVSRAKGKPEEHPGLG